VSDHATYHAADEQPWQLVITFGVLYPFAAVTYLPCATILFEWFSARRGLAGGIMFAGTGVGGTFFPFLITGLIGRFGYKAAMISLGIGYGVLCSIALIPIQRRLPLPRRRAGAIGDEAIRRPKATLEFLRHRLVWIGCGVIMLSSLGNFVPSLWLPSKLPL
jgi:MFS family permease